METDSKCNNSNIWNKVAITDPSFTAAFGKPGGFQGTSVSSTYHLLKATELWGPCGYKWGYDIIKEDMIQGPAVQFDSTGAPVTNSALHTLRIELYYPVSDTETGRIPGFGATPVIVKTATGYKTDDDFAKKSLSDALSNCFKALGFSADVHLGLFNNDQHVKIAKQLTGNKTPFIGHNEGYDSKFATVDNETGEIVGQPILSDSDPRVSGTLKAQLDSVRAFTSLDLIKAGEQQAGQKFSGVILDYVKSVLQSRKAEILQITKAAPESAPPPVAEATPVPSAISSDDDSRLSDENRASLGRIRQFDSIELIGLGKEQARKSFSGVVLEYFERVLEQQAEHLAIPPQPEGPIESLDDPRLTAGVKNVMATIAKFDTIEKLERGELQAEKTFSGEVLAYIKTYVQTLKSGMQSPKSEPAPKIEKVVEKASQAKPADSPITSDDDSRLTDENRASLGRIRQFDSIELIGLGQEQAERSFTGEVLEYFERVLEQQSRKLRAQPESPIISDDDPRLSEHALRALRVIRGFTNMELIERGAAQAQKDFSGEVLAYVRKALDIRKDCIM